jgi:hypothetical protein
MGGSQRPYPASSKHPKLGKDYYVVRMGVGDKCSIVSGEWTAEAPLASDNDNPAAPNKGTAHARVRRMHDVFALKLA